MSSRLQQPPASMYLLVPQTPASIFSTLRLSHKSQLGRRQQSKMFLLPISLQLPSTFGESLERAWDSIAPSDLRDEWGRGASTLQDEGPNEASKTVVRISSAVVRTKRPRQIQQSHPERELTEHSSWQCCLLWRLCSTAAAGC